MLLEPCLAELYESQPLLEDMVAFMVDSGFRFAGPAGVIRRPADGRPLALDALFEKRAQR